MIDAMLEIGEDRTLVPLEAVVPLVPIWSESRSVQDRFWCTAGQMREAGTGRSGGRTDRGDEAGSREGGLTVRSGPHGTSAFPLRPHPPHCRNVFQSTHNADYSATETRTENLLTASRRSFSAPTGTAH